MIVRDLKNHKSNAQFSNPVVMTGSVLSHHEFLKLCEYERLRAERSNSTFCVISFNFGDSEIIQQNESNIQSAFESRIRQIDEIGYLSQTELGIMVPHTEPEGAKSLVENLLPILPDSLPTPIVTIYEHQADPPEPRQEKKHTTKKTKSTLLVETDVTKILVKPMPLWKRSMDIAGASIGLLILSPLLIFLAVVIKCTSRGPIVFKQKRTGYGGQTFWMYKFRSMVCDAEKQRDELTHLNEQDGPAFKIKSDPRITWIGRWLRSLSLDELPQLWNVLKGDMSFVGPRPLPCHEAQQCKPWQRQRLNVVPGITCIWQVQDRSVAIPFDEWMRMDIQYAQSISLKQDFTLLTKTLGFLIGKRNC